MPFGIGQDGWLPTEPFQCLPSKQGFPADRVDLSALERKGTGAQDVGTCSRLNFERSWLLSHAVIYWFNRCDFGCSHACCIIATSQIAFDRCKVSKAIPGILFILGGKPNEGPRR